MVLYHSKMYSKSLTFNLANIFLKQPIHEIGNMKTYCIEKNIAVKNMNKKLLKVSKDRKKEWRAIRKNFANKDRDNKGRNAYSSEYF